MGKLLSHAEKTERFVRVSERLGMDVRQVIDLRDEGAPFFMPYKFALLGGLSEHASDEYEQRIAHELLRSGRQDLVMQNDDGSYRVLPLMRFNYDSDHIAEIEKLLPQPHAVAAMYDIMRLGKLNALAYDCDAMAAACNTVQIFVIGDAITSDEFRNRNPSYVCPETEIDILDISAPVFAELKRHGIEAGDVVLVLGTTLTLAKGNMWPGMLNREGIGVARIGAEAQQAMNHMIYNDVAWHARSAIKRQDSVSGGMSMQFMHDKLHRGWNTMLQHATASVPGDTPIAAVIEACTDFVAPLAAAHGVVPGTHIPVFNTLDLHSRAIAQKIAAEAPEFTPEMREKFAANPPHKSTFIGGPGRAAFVPKQPANDRGFKGPTG